MRIEAFALLGVFTAVSIAAGVLAWRLIVPESRWGAVLPAAAAFGALYLVGHRLGWTFGPSVRLFGYDVALAWEVLLAVGVALLAAGAARLAGSLLRG
jgi:hypothetical protein